MYTQIEKISESTDNKHVTPVCQKKVFSDKYRKLSSFGNRKNVFQRARDERSPQDNSKQKVEGIYNVSLFLNAGANLYHHNRWATFAGKNTAMMSGMMKLVQVKKEYDEQGGRINYFNMVSGLAYLLEGFGENAHFLKGSSVYSKVAPGMGVVADGVQAFQYLQKEKYLKGMMYGAYGIGNLMIYRGFHGAPKKIALALGMGTQIFEHVKTSLDNI